MKPQNIRAQLNAKELRDLPEKPDLDGIQRSPLYLILDNVYDTYNIGGLFRLADALAVSKLLICGDSETPPNHRIKKASVGTYKIVPWEYHETTIGAIEQLRQDLPNINIVSVELSNNSVPYSDYAFTAPTAIVVGHETHGVSEEVMQASDAVVELPMHGYNISLNVIVSAAIVSYHAHNTISTSDPS